MKRFVGAGHARDGSRDPLNHEPDVARIAILGGCGNTGSRVARLLAETGGFEPRRPRLGAQGEHVASTGFLECLHTDTPRVEGRRGGFVAKCNS